VRACPAGSLCVEAEPEPFVLGKACCEDVLWGKAYPKAVVCLILIQKIFCKIKFIPKICCGLRLIPRTFFGLRLILKMYEVRLILSIFCH